MQHQRGEADSPRSQSRQMAAEPSLRSLGNSWPRFQGNHAKTWVCVLGQGNSRIALYWDHLNCRPWSYRKGGQGGWFVGLRQGGRRWGDLVKATEGFRLPTAVPVAPAENVPHVCHFSIPFPSLWRCQIHSSHSLVPINKLGFLSFERPLLKGLKISKKQYDSQRMGWANKP